MNYLRSASDIKGLPKREKRSSAVGQQGKIERQTGRHQCSEFNSLATSNKRSGPSGFSAPDYEGLSLGQGGDDLLLQTPQSGEVARAWARLVKGEVHRDTVMGAIHHQHTV